MNSGEQGCQVSSPRGLIVFIDITIWSYFLLTKNDKYNFLTNNYYTPSRYSRILAAGWWYGACVVVRLAFIVPPVITWRICSLFLYGTIKSKSVFQIFSEKKRTIHYNPSKYL